MRGGSARVVFASFGWALRRESRALRALWGFAPAPDSATRDEAIRELRSVALMAMGDGVAGMLIGIEL